MVNIENVGTYLFLGHINCLEVSATDVGNPYLHGFSKENIYTLVGPDFGEWEDYILIFVR